MSASITVSEGETLSKLSLMYSISPSRLRVINDLGIHDVHPGDVLKIESPIEYLYSRHQLVVMLISSSEFFRENNNQDDNSTKKNQNTHNMNEFSLLKTAISGSAVLTDDLLIFNQLQTGKQVNKERYTFFINLVAISSTNLVPFYKHFHKNDHQKTTKTTNEEKAGISQQNHQKNSLSFFKKLFSSKEQQNENSQKDDDDDDDNEFDTDSSSSQPKNHSNQPEINFNGVETFSTQYEDEPSILEVCFFNDPLNKSLGVKSISLFASRAELNSLDFLINFFSRQRRIEIGLKLVCHIEQPPPTDQKTESTPNAKATHSSSAPISQVHFSSTHKKASLINIFHDENCDDFETNVDSYTIENKFFVDDNPSFGCAIEMTVTQLPDSHFLPKRTSSMDNQRKVGSFTPQSNLSLSQVVTKSTLNTLAPISCNSLKFSNAIIPDSSSPFFTDDFSYSQYPTSLTDSTSMILDCVNITMIRSHFPHRIMSAAWKLVFRLSRDGCSYHTLLDRTRDGRPCVLAILTTKGESIGAFLGDGIHEGKSKSSGGSSFIFSFTVPTKKNRKSSKTNNDLDDSEDNSNNDNDNDTDSSPPKSTYFRRRNAKVYRWSMLNDKFIIISTTDLMVGSTSVNNDRDKFKNKSRLFSNYNSDLGAGCGAAIWIDQKMNKGISENCPTFNSPPLIEGGTFNVNDIEVWSIY